jgi:ABC-type bacteriocin/lantibiotic exporter with double-glycine peptidase domain
MALTTTSVQQPTQSTAKPGLSFTDAASPLLAALLLSVYAAQKSKKQLRKLTRTALLGMLKFQMNSTFSRIKSFFTGKAPAPVSSKTIIYILIGVLALVLVFYYPLIALIVAVAGIVYFLLSR